MIELHMSFLRTFMINYWIIFIFFDKNLNISRSIINPKNAHIPRKRNPCLLINSVILLNSYIFLSCSQTSSFSNGLKLTMELIASKSTPRHDGSTSLPLIGLSDTVKFRKFATIYSILNKSQTKSNMIPILRNSLKKIGTIRENSNKNEVLLPRLFTYSNSVIDVIYLGTYPKI